MGPLPRSFAADAYDCIMVPILTDRPNTRMRAIFAPDSELPSELSSSVLTTRRLTNVSLPRARARDRQGRSLRDGLRPPFTVTARCGQRKPGRAEEDDEIALLRLSRALRVRQSGADLSHRKLLSSKAMVVSVAETPGQDSGRHGRERRAQANRCRSVESGLVDVRTGG